MDAVEEIKSRLSIEDVISEYVQLKRAGQNFKGLSPFTNEKTPSFVVSPEKQIWHDFSSNRGGDMFTFVMEMEGVDFKGALDVLARRAGVDLEQFQSKKRGNSKEKERLYELLELAAKFYQVQFSKNKMALEYVFQKRQFNKEAALAFQLGYSPNTGDALVKFAKAKGFSEREIKQAGLTNRFGGDLFRGRLMVPLADAQGRVIGFTARDLAGEPNAPKYINTPGTPLYDKSRHIYGLHLAKESIRKSKFVVLAEGNLDVIASHQAGVKQCVATAGTALTEPQLKALNRFTGDIRLAFDADRAGIAATERAIPIASKVGVSLSVITIPNGKDPDELIRQDAALWHGVTQKKQYALDWLIERYKTELDITSAIGKRQFSDTILAVVRSLHDPVEQDHYVQTVANIIGVNHEALRLKLDAKLESDQVLRQRNPKTELKIDKNAFELTRAQNRLMALILLQPRLRDLLTSLQLDFLPDTQAKEIYQFLVAHPDFDGSPIHTKQLKSLAEYCKMLTLQYEELYQDLELLELRYEAERLQAYLVEQYVKTQKHENKQKLENAEEGEQTALLQRDKALNELLKKYKRGS